MVLYQIPILILTLSLVSIFIAPEEPFAFQLFFKLLPMIVILGYAFRLVPKDKRAVHWFLIAGLFFSMLGDATIHWFSFGLGAYFLAHLCYIIGFYSLLDGKKPRLFIVLPSAMYAGIFSWILGSDVGAGEENVQLIPIILYVLLFSLTFVIASITRNKPAMLGTFLYLVSHSLLLWNEYVTPFVYAEEVLMLIYYAAQFFIAVSLYSLIERNRRIIW